ncbi:hypothetical protein DPMN_139204 [Dreissena polymorpha]|uniref:Uncharacterized protein n=1 Tax=Dreissena polymorpha TaxID=45954 RepID=A0A9D4G8L5_DREPO|nr:hypothetical protein DPMN_139204 [Dreissena polymorpha]
MNLRAGVGKGSLMEETALKTYLSNAIVHIVTQQAVKRASRDHFPVEKCIHSKLSAEMTKEDPDIQMLLIHAKDLYSSLLRG